jgi:hypothetical protein
MAPEMIVDHHEIPGLRSLLLERYEFLREQTTNHHKILKDKKIKTY